MDEQRIDDMVRQFAAGFPRRRVIAGLFAGILAPLVGRPAGVEAAACKKTGKKCDKNSDCCDHAHCPGNKCRCKQGFQDCDGKCYKLANDEKHCGQCDNKCTAKEKCCDGDCADLDTDSDHCGSCSNKCVATEECISGSCVPTPGGCPAGASHCLSDEDVPCPDYANCVCQQSTEGRTMCAEIVTAGSFCGNCATSADCASFGDEAFCMVTDGEKCCGPSQTGICRLPCPDIPNVPN